MIKTITVIEYTNFLEEHGLWPMQSWNHFEFLHQEPRDSFEAREQFIFLRNIVARINGLYAYAIDGTWIYVGKGKPLLERLKIHYHSSYKPVSGDTKTLRWHRFFRENTGPLTIYWKEVEPETDRRIFEIALTELLKPTFDQFR